MEVAEHGVRLPTTNQLEGVRVDASTEEGGSGFNFMSLDVHGIGTYHGDAGAQSVGDLPGSHMAKLRGRVEEGTKRSSTWKGAETKVEDLTDYCGDETYERGATATMCNDLTPDSILLGGENKLHVCGRIELGHGTGEDGEGALAGKKPHIG